VCEADGFVFLALDPPRNRVLSVPDAWGPDFQRGYLHSSSVAVGAGLMLDNFLDLSHFPFVHAATIGTDHATRFDMEIERHPTGMRVWSEHLFPNSEDPAVARGERPLLQSRRLTYTYEAPFSVCLRIDYVEAGGTNILSFHVQPIDDQTCSLYTLVARNDLAGDEQRMAQALAFEQRVIDEDVRLQTRYRDKRLPLDVTREVHVKVDRMTVELRRILADFVAHPGEASRTRNSRDPSTRVPARP
jgi:vanillate O-demethylase monooxygenase subunit